MSEDRKPSGFIDVAVTRSILFSQEPLVLTTLISLFVRLHSIVRVRLHGCVARSITWRRNKANKKLAELVFFFFFRMILWMKWRQNTSPSGHLLFQSKSVFFKSHMKCLRFLKESHRTRLCVRVCACDPSSIQAVDVEAVAVTVKELVSYALTLNPNNQSWLITQADIYFGKFHMFTPQSSPGGLPVCPRLTVYHQPLFVVTNQYSAALNLYLQAGAVCSDFFTKTVPPDIYTDQVAHAGPRTTKSCNLWILCEHWKCENEPRVAR